MGKVWRFPRLSITLNVELLSFFVQDLKFHILGINSIENVDKF